MLGFFTDQGRPKRGGAERYSDLFVVAGLIAVISLMILPLPLFLLDALVALNITFAAILLLSAVYIATPLELAVFPSVLLMSTLFRLALSVATTRMILLEANAGPDHRHVREHGRGRQRGGRPRHLPHHHGRAVHGHRQGRRAGGRGRRALQPGRDARQADVDRQRLALRPADQEPGRREAARLGVGIQALRLARRRHEVRQGRLDGVDHHHLDQHHRRARHRHRPARHARRRGDADLLHPDDRRRAGRAGARAPVRDGGGPDRDAHGGRRGGDAPGRRVGDASSARVRAC